MDDHTYGRETVHWGEPMTVPEFPYANGLLTLLPLLKLAFSPKAFTCSWYFKHKELNLE